MSVVRVLPTRVLCLPGVVSWSFQYVHGGFSQPHGALSQDLESVDQEGWQSFDLTSYADQTVSSIAIVIKGTGSGAPGFKILDANFLGEEVIVPSDGTISVSSPRCRALRHTFKEDRRLSSR